MAIIHISPYLSITYMVINGREPLLVYNDIRVDL